jgi:hypothetical protein
MGHRGGRESLWLAGLALIVLTLGGAAWGASTAGGSHPDRRAGAAGFPLIKIHFEFRIEERATHYTVVNTSQPGSVNLDGASYFWKLTPPGNDPNCNNHGNLTGTGKEFVWHHGNVGDPISDDGCNHDGNTLGPTGHQGTVTVQVEDASWSCTASYTGTQRADGNASGDGPDGDCAAVGPPSPPPPPPSATPDCDKEKAALAAAQARLAALEEALKPLQAAASKAIGDLLDAIVRAKKASGLLDDLAHVITLGSVMTDVDKALADGEKAGAALDQADELIKGLESKLRQARLDVFKAEDALAACGRGGSGLRLSSARPQASSRVAVCGAQQIALARAQARLSVYRSTARSFLRLGLAGARGRLQQAQQLFTGAKSKLPASPGVQKLVPALDKAAASFGLAAARTGDLTAAVGRLQGKVKPAQQQAAKAESALAACSAGQS